MQSRALIADESEDLGEEVRLLLYGRRNRRYKIHYSIRYKGPSTGTVRVFHVRHWARKSLSAAEVEILMEEDPANG